MIGEKSYIQPFENIGLDDLALVGGKNASLGEMISNLNKAGIRVPLGFAITSRGYRDFLSFSNLQEKIKHLLFDSETPLKDNAANIRSLIEQQPFPDLLKNEIVSAYAELSQLCGDESIEVAVRSSATVEDLPDASFAGQQDTYLNIQGDDAVLQACRKCFASLFNERAILYRQEKGFDSLDVYLSVGIQKMISADVSGVAFSLEPESGCEEIITINASYGLGEAVVQGEVTPDEYLVFKPALNEKSDPLIRRKCGSKEKKLVFNSQTRTSFLEEVPEDVRKRFALTESEIISLSRMVQIVENYYSKRKGMWCPMDVEWVKDASGFYLVQARPETIHSQREKSNVLTTYQLQNKYSVSPILSGQSIGQKIVSGSVRILLSLDEIDAVREGDIIVTTITSPDWVRAMKKAVGLITEQGGRTCHAAIVSRELGLPAIVGAKDIMASLKTGDKVTLDCSSGNTGYIYPGTLNFIQNSFRSESIPHPPVKIMINLADPDRAFSLSRLPVSGVGLARLEFIITQTIKIHPLALLRFDKIDDLKIRATIESLTENYTSKRQYFIEEIMSGIATIAAAFYPRPVIVRCSDFKSNEYRNLIGGSYFEPSEENPMIGCRGASRYYSDFYREAFSMECEALRRVREEKGLTNVQVMIPFVRTLTEGRRVRQELRTNGLIDVPVIMMCEIPSNVLLIEEFSQIFDGFSIGSNDLTQLTLGVDRDSGILSDLFDERDPAVLKMFKNAIIGAKKHGKYIGICGQGPSDYPDLAQYLIDLGIDSISLNPDSVLPFLMRS